MESTDDETAHDPWAEMMAMRDLEFVKPLFPGYAAFIRTWFRPEVEGLEHVPESGALLVGNHSGGVPPYESMVFVTEFVEQLGFDAPLYWLAHSLIMRMPGLGEFLLRCGVLPASRDAAKAVLERGGFLVVYPGGELDLHRPWQARNEIRFEGRKGFLRIADETGVPLVPVVAAGGQSTYLPLTDGRRVAHALRLDRILGLKVMPLALSFPWGLSSGLLPHLPAPVQIRVRVLPPIDVRAEFGGDLDTAYDSVTSTMQEVLDELSGHPGGPPDA